MRRWFCQRQLSIHGALFVCGYLVPCAPRVVDHGYYEGHIKLVWEEETCSGVCLSDTTHWRCRICLWISVHMSGSVNQADIVIGCVVGTLYCLM